MIVVFSYYKATKNIPIEDVDCGYLEDTREGIDNVNTSGAIVLDAA